MALTKLPRNAIGTGAIDATKIEDGTIQAVELSGTLPDTKLSSTLDISGKTVTLPNTSVTNDQLVNTTIANAKLSNSTITVRGTSRALGDSFSLQVDVDWQSVQTVGFTAAVGRGYFVNTTSGVITVTLPASANIGDQIAIKDYAGTFATNNLTIARNGHNIQGVANNSLISTNRASLVLVYVDATKGWLFTDEHNVGNLELFGGISATGGTITTVDTDYKVHAFTGDGSFIVSCAGLGPGNKVDYLVIAGGAGGGGGEGANGAGGGGGAGGAGGYRYAACTYSAPACGLGAGASIPVSATTYPITVGGGGSGGSPSATGNPGDQGSTSGTKGSNSVFTTITSAGGGSGTGQQQSNPNQPGGSGGGGGGDSGGTGTGNTPPVSPPQGTNGVGGAASRTGGGGGGSQSAGCGANGGSGNSNSITGSPVTRGGGGGGGAGSGPRSGGTGGSGGGGNGGNANPAGNNSPAGGQQSGSSNTGGGGGGKGASGGDSAGGGGSGIVIIRYKFQ